MATPHDEGELRALLAEGPLIARGNGRSYGDSAHLPDRTVDMRRLNRVLEFDAERGTVVAEAGLLLEDLLDRTVPLGWFPCVTPGTKHVTLGGMVAADVHGKNHHREGSFGRFVEWLDVLQADGTVVRASPERHDELFRWTIGGMGLTGVILRACFRMLRIETGWIRQRLIPTPHLDAAMEAFEAHSGAPYSVAWLDCLASGEALGRSLLMTGEHAALGELARRHQTNPFPAPRGTRATIPFDLPGGVLNRHTIGAFNAIYHRRGVAKEGERIVDWDSYFYPLDSVGAWNRLYGPRGLLQFQCVIPLPAARAGLGELLRRISGAGEGSFLAVLKRFGPQSDPFSFPTEGYTLALDFPLRGRTLELLSELDAIVVDHGGRFYLAKDGRMSAATLSASDARVEVFRSLREERGWRERFRSAQSDRLSL